LLGISDLLKSTYKLIIFGAQKSCCFCRNQQLEAENKSDSEAPPAAAAILHRPLAFYQLNHLTDNCVQQKPITTKSLILPYLLTGPSWSEPTAILNAPLYAKKPCKLKHKLDILIDY